MPLVPIGPTDFNVDLDLAYGGPDNFTGEIIYRRPACHLHQAAVPYFAAAVRRAAAHGLRLRIFDAFRPAEAQWRLWAHFPDADFVADPRLGSPHSRGVAVDLTLVDESGAALDMGTGFDDFTARSHHGAAGLTSAQERNRFLLMGIMLSSGFRHYPQEWWHYHLEPHDHLPLLSDSTLSPGML